jgi:uncharacterized protein (DUF885 family)
MTDTVTSRPVDELADWFWEGFLERQPVYATFLGDERYDDRLDDPGPSGRAAEVAAYREVLERSSTVDSADLEVEDRITLHMLQVIARIGLAQHEQQLYQLASIDQFSGPQLLPGDLARFQKADTADRFERLLARLARFPAYVEAHLGNISEGIAARRTAAKPVVARVAEQTRRILETPVDGSALMVGLTGLTEERRPRLREALERHVYPATRRWLAGLEAYAPHARAEDGIWSLPDGDATYRTAILAHTTVDAGPDELHAYGQQQIEAIDRERARIARELGHPDVSSLRNALQTDPSNFARRPEELVEHSIAQVQRAAAAAPRYFGRQPRAACIVKAVEPFQEQEAPPAFYLPPASDGSRPGTYYVNTYRPESRPLHQLATRTYHEAVPGHHFQISIEFELEELHPFRRHGSRLAGVGFPEGWGLYSERLADEMGLFEDSRERFGMLDAQAWRAARLVVDTGIHAFRWDRQRSVELLTRIGLSQLEAETETDRYICWPGQALAYYVGQREIFALRRQLERRDAARFDLKAFHDEVLAHGAIPLATLRQELPNWLPSAGPSRGDA